MARDRIVDFAREVRTDGDGDLQALFHFHALTQVHRTLGECWHQKTDCAPAPKERVRLQKVDETLLEATGLTIAHLTNVLERIGSLDMITPYHPGDDCQGCLVETIGKRLAMSDYMDSEPLKKLASRIWHDCQVSCQSMHLTVDSQLPIWANTINPRHTHIHASDDCQKNHQPPGQPPGGDD